MPVDNRVRRMVEELRTALIQAIRSSDEVSEVVRKIRRQGLSLQLLLSCEQRDDPENRISDRRRIGLGSGEAVPDPWRDRPGRKDAAFRLNGQDVTFLESMGIDPTRRVRPRRRRRGS